MKMYNCLSLAAARVRSLSPVVSAVLLLAPTLAPAQPSPRTIDEAMHHLGDSEIKDWPGIAVKPEGTGLKMEFTATANASPFTLRIRQRDVDGVWQLKLNERKVGELRRHQPDKECYYELPTGALRDGANSLELIPDNKTDDVAVGNFVLHHESLRSLLKLQRVTLRVIDGAAGGALPARIAIESVEGKAADIYLADSERVAIREGLIYVPGGAQFELARGKYRIAATRGMEWSRAEQLVELAAEPASLELKLRREVDTTGFVAADTHIHTYTFSGHGDATVEERMLSLAGEGVELAVATDHNHNTDYQPYQAKLGLNEFFTPVTGNEITTENGHFNGFPLKPGDEVPPYQETNWVKVVEGIRMKGARVVILNHPRWPKIEESPFSNFGLNRATGDRASGTPFTFDAMELVNSTVDTPDPLYLFTDWFALLNAGEKISAVGSSDSHSVGDPVGQGRTYLPSRSDSAAGLNVAELADSLRMGRAAVSLGIFASVQVNERFAPGDLALIADGKVNVRLRVAAPGWVRPRKAVVFLNGASVAEQDVPNEPGKPTDSTLSFFLPIRGVDAHLVCIVLGDPVKHAGWKTLNDYTLAATNPVFLDVNGDGKYNSPRESAQRIYGSLGGDVDALMNTLEIVPAPVGVQILALAHDRFQGLDLARLNEAIKRLAELNPAFVLYQSSRAAALKAAPAPAK